MYSLIFQSTPSAGRATIAYRRRERLRYISIHALRGEGDVPKVSKYTTQINFNPRPPRGGRLYSIIPHSLPRYFNPRPPRGGRRQSQRIYMTRCQISIHALRGEGDFNPRPPRGGRHPRHRFQRVETDFNPRPPRGGRRLRYIWQSCYILDFNPRPPRGGRPTT